MGAPVVHFEVLGQDGGKLQTFYSELFDWTINADNPMKYGLVEAQGGKGIGGGVGAGGDAPNHVTFYVEVDDLQAYLDRLERMGGKTIVPVTEIPNMVTFALFADPEGNTVGLVKSE